MAFKVFKRRKSINVEEESSEVQTSEEPTTITLLGEPVFSLHQTEETIIDFPSSSSSSSLGRQSIFEKFIEMKNKNEALNTSTYAEFLK